MHVIHECLYYKRPPSVFEAQVVGVRKTVGKELRSSLFCGLCFQFILIDDKELSFFLLRTFYFKMHRECCKFGSHFYKTVAYSLTCLDVYSLLKSTDLVLTCFKNPSVEATRRV